MIIMFISFLSRRLIFIKEKKFSILLILLRLIRIYLLSICNILLLFLFIIEPHSYKEGITSSNWITAMQNEIDVHEGNNTWYVTSLPLGKILIGCK